MKWWKPKNNNFRNSNSQKKNNVSGAGKLTRFHIFFMVLAYSTVRASQNHMICSIIRKYLAGRHCRCIFEPKSLAEIHYRHGTLYRYRVGSGRNNKNRRNQSKKYMTSSDSPDQFTPAWTPTFPALFPFTRDRRSEFPSKWSPRVVPRLWSCCFLQPLTIRPLEPRNELKWWIKPKWT